MADFDQLSIKISANSTKAVNAVNKLADALSSLNAQLAALDPSRFTTMANAARDMQAATRQMGNVRSARGMEALANAASKMGAQKENINQTAEATQRVADAANNAAQATQQAANGVGNESSNGWQRFSTTLQNVGSSARNAGSGIVKFGNNLKNIFPHAKKATSGLHGVSRASKSTRLTAKGLAKELLRVSKMFKLMITRMVLRKIISGIGDGFKNLAQYSSQVNASMSLLWNSFRQLGNSIAAAASPLLNAFAPALNAIIQLCIKAVNAINQLVSALLGLGTWTRAKTLTDSYADSLKSASGAAKELKKTVLGFDELNQLQDNNSGGGGGATSPADMFETADIADKWKKLADKIKKYWLKFIDPIKKAWANVGDYVKESWINAFESVKKLAMDIVDDFLEVWNQPATLTMLENILKIVAHIGEFVGNLADSFDKAWNKADVGKRILEKIRDLAAIVVDYVEQITDSWAKWAAEVDFTPLLEGIDSFLESMKKPVDFLMGVFKDFNEEFLQPVAKWATENGAPELLKVFEDFNNRVDWDLLRDRLDKLWVALSNFTMESGQGIIQFIGDIASKLADGINSDAFGKLVDVLVDFLNNVNAEDVEDALKIIFTAIVAYKTLTWLSACTTALKTFFALFGASGAATQAAGNMATVASSVNALGTAFASIGLTGHIGEGISNLKNVWEQRHAMDNYVISIEDVRKSQNDFVNQYGKDMKMLKETGLDYSKSTQDVGRTVQTETYNIKEAYASATTSIQGDLLTLEKSNKDTTDTIKKSFDKSEWTFSGVADGLKDTFDSAKSAIAGVWNKIADSLNGTHTIGTGSFRINLPKLYATGGFPEDGLFMANHNELVGRFSNGKTAVANNEQITNGIAQAVYSAITAANSGGSGATYINNTIEVDGVAIARAVTKGQERLDRRYSPTMA